MAAAASANLDESLDLRHALGRLAHSQRLVVVLRFYLDLPFAEIAVIAGISEAAARARVHRALQRLHGDLSPAEATP